MRAELLAAQRRGLSFAAAVDQFLPVKAAELSEGKYRDQWRASIDRYVTPVLGQMSVSEVTLHDVLRVLEPIWVTKTATAEKLRRKINEVLDFATIKGHRNGPNPARWDGNLSLALPAPSSMGKDENYPALQLRDAPRFWNSLSERSGMGAAALRFQTLTATRPGAVRFMTWREVDMEQRVWTVQPSRMMAKIGRHDAAKRVPLTDATLELLKALPRSAEQELVFWAPRGGAMSDATMAKLMLTIHDADVRKGGPGFRDAKTGEVAVPHGTRSLFKVWASELTGYDWNLSEAALWHRLGSKVEQAYARTDMLEKRRQMMADWESFLMAAPRVGKVVFIETGR